MAKLERKTAKIFGNTASPSGNDPQIGQFGSAKSGAYLGTDNIDTIQALPAWNNGWSDAVISDQQYPPLPEMTGVHKVLSYQNAYLLQQGIPEWDSGTIYYKNSFCAVNGVIYVSQSDENTNNNPTTDKTNWVEFGASAAIPIGTVFPVISTPDYIPTGALPCNGAEYTAAQFQDFYDNYLTATTPLLLTCTYTEYQSDITTYGQCAKFAVDTENNLFKVPTIKEGAYITQASADTSLGKSYNESLPNLTGQFVPSQGDNSSYNRFGTRSKKIETGVFYTLNDVGSGQVINETSGGYQGGSLHFDASRSSSVYQTGANVQGNNVRLRYFVQVSNGTINDAQMDWSQWATGLLGKANIDADNLSATGIAQIDNNVMPCLAAKSFQMGTALPTNTVVTAPANGWIMLETTAGISYLINQTSGLISSHQGAGNMHNYIPVCKNDNVQLQYASGAAFTQIVFYYCRGEQPS